MSIASASLISALPSPFGGFAPFPNSIMIPFMGAQSAVLAYQFGINYEFGKRTIKAMSNEEFNALVTTPEGREGLSNAVRQHALQTLTDFRNIIPDFQSLQNDIIEQSVLIELKKAERTPSAMVEILQTLLASSQGAFKEFIDTLDSATRSILFQLFPLLGVLYEQELGQTTPPEEVPPSEEPPTEPPAEEPPELLTTVVQFFYSYAHVCEPTEVNPAIIESSTPPKDAFAHATSLDGIKSVSNPIGTCQERTQHNRLVSYSAQFLEFYGQSYTSI